MKTYTFTTAEIVVMIICYLFCMAGAMFSSYVIGEARGEENIYLDCRDRGSFELHGDTFVCGVG